MNDGVINDSFGLANVNEVLASFGHASKSVVFRFEGRTGKHGRTRTRSRREQESKREKGEKESRARTTSSSRPIRKRERLDYNI